MGNHSHRVATHNMSASPSVRARPATFAELPRLIASAPHRLLFLAGAIAVMLSMTWWALELTWLRFGLGG
ncbi:MAG: hypothetical protein WC617_11235, partial [Rhodanobacter sp.]